MEIDKLSTEIEKAAIDEKQLIKHAKNKRESANGGTEDQVKAANEEAEKLEKEAHEKRQSITAMKSRQEDLREKIYGPSMYRTIGGDGDHEVY